MLSDKLKKWLIKNRAWVIHELLQKLPIPESDVIAALYDQIELATFSEALRLHVLWPSLNKNLSVREDYVFPESRLHIVYYLNFAPKDTIICDRLRTSDQPR